MNKLELISTNCDVDDYINSMNSVNETSCESANDIIRYNKRHLLNIFFSGSLLIAMPCQDALAEKISLTESYETFDSSLYKYNQTIDLPFSQFLNQVNQICSAPKYSKKEITKEILSFKSLSNNWDGRSAIPLEVESALNALTLIELLGETSFNKINEFFPNPNGTISFQWSNESDEAISLEIGNAEMSYYVELNSKETFYCNNVEINATETKKLSDFIKVL